MVCPHCGARLRVIADARELARHRFDLGQMGEHAHARTLSYPFASIVVGGAWSSACAVLR
jgi:hypothetical protein